MKPDGEVIWEYRNMYDDNQIMEVHNQWYLTNAEFERLNAQCMADKLLVDH